MQKRVHCVLGSLEVLKEMGWVENEDSWDLGSEISKLAISATATLIQSKINFLKVDFKFEQKPFDSRFNRLRSAG